jgi:hypothetical protein
MAPVSDQHAPSAPAPATPSDPRTLARVRRFRFNRDLIVIALGIVVFVLGLAGGGSSTTWGIALAMIVIFAIAAVMHARMRSYRQAWTRGTRTTLSVLGLLLGLYFGAAGISGFGAFGQQTTATATQCVPVAATPGTDARQLVAHDDCTFDARWPDGTTTRQIIALSSGEGDGTRVVLHRPPATFRWVNSTQAQTPWPDAVALVLAGLLLIGQAVVSLTILATGAYGDRPGPPVRH